MTAEIITYLTTGYWELYGEKSRSFNISSGDTLTVNITALTPDGQNLARAALEAWSSVSGIKFQFVSDNDAHIIFDDNEPGAFSYSTTTANGTIIQSYVNVSTEWLRDFGIQFDSYSYTTYIHEIGHALGLGHAGPYNGGHPNVWFDTISLYDSWQVSVMSYINQAESLLTLSPVERASYAHPVTPMLADVAAIHELYGKPDSINVEDTVYGRGANMGGHAEQYFKSWTGEGNPFFNVRLAGQTAPTFVDEDYDGDLDLITLNSSRTIMYLYENIGTSKQPNFVYAESFNWGGYIIDFEFADFDADGDTDFVLADSSGLHFAFNLANEDVDILFIPVILQSDYDLELVDIDGDSDLDIVEIDAQGAYLYENTGTRYRHEFDPNTYTYFPGDFSWVKTFEFVDVDNDGDFDIIAADYYGGLYYEENIGTSRAPNFADTIYLANPLDAALYSAVIPSGLLNDFAFVDLDGDSDMDFFSLDTYGDVYYFENNSTPDLLHFEPTSFYKKTTFTLYDTDGYDTLDLRTDSSDQAIDMNPLGVSNIYGLKGNVIIGPDTYIERVYAGSGNDVIIGNSAANRIYGMDGHDLIKGNEGNDVLVGDNGNDLISGGPGNDWIYGRKDNDQLHGGHGNDTFVFGENEGNDWIADFGNGKDRLHVAAFETIQSIEDITIYRSGNNTIVDLSAHGGDSITLENFTEPLDATDFYFG